MNIDNILTLTNDTPLPEIETNTGCCLVHKLTKLIWTGKHLADEGGTDGGCHCNDIRTCIYYDIYVSNCFSVSRILLAKPHSCFYGRGLSEATAGENQKFRIKRSRHLLMMGLIATLHEVSLKMSRNTTPISPVIFVLSCIKATESRF